MKKLEIWEDGEVRWFDNFSGEGMIRVEGKSIYCHWSAIAEHFDSGGLKDAHKKPKQVWCVLFPKQKVKVKVLRDSHFQQISAVK